HGPPGGGPRALRKGRTCSLLDSNLIARQIHVGLTRQNRTSPARSSRRPPTTQAAFFSYGPESRGPEALCRPWYVCFGLTAPSGARRGAGTSLFGAACLPAWRYRPRPRSGRCLATTKKLIKIAPLTP